ARLRHALRLGNLLLSRAEVPEPVVGLVVAGLTVAVAQLLDPLREQGVESLTSRRSRLREGLVLFVGELDALTHVPSSSCLLHLSERGGICTRTPAIRGVAGCRHAEVELLWAPVRRAWRTSRLIALRSRNAWAPISTTWLVRRLS